MNRQYYFLTGLLFLGACAKAPDVTKKTTQTVQKPETIRPYDLFSVDDKLNFTELPLRGDARDQKHFWSGDFWPLNKGNINRRWNADVRIGFNHRSIGLDELRTMPEEKIAQLAPSEKLDLLMGMYDYPLRREVNIKAANIQAEVWESMINGWAVASYIHVEPQPKTLMNPDGIAIPFGSEDIKGLLGYYYAYHAVPTANFMIGKPCTKIGCIEDVTAASFHLALANKLGVKKEAFLMDLDRGRDVWNHPVVSFVSEYRGNAELHSGVTPGTATIVRMRTTVTYIDEALNQTWAPVIGTQNQLETTQMYQYWLHLDRDSNIIGGEWKSNERPDYLWSTVAAIPQFDGNLAGLNALIDDPKPPVVVTETDDTTTTDTTTDTTTTDDTGPVVTTDDGTTVTDPVVTGNDGGPVITN